ncbi:hypothetical protein O7599_29325 [Streptomyces sp. WMMC500]|uniref:hypothetical protein n=1 Tax=Streptomyces sp. WMMC500 TaxID=3015154 RepID=UPI00248BADD0|nr:hypothetical protein [Streptomyces sp. WMMC500]WBB59624.1 hypothetical protein O7599_29325 [Streptomyces sp. WMMC500]
MATENEDQQHQRALLQILYDARKYDEIVRTDGGWSIQDGSALAGDDPRTHPYELSGAAWSALSVARVHLRCLYSSLTGLDIDGDVPEQCTVTVHTHAQYTLIRGLLENGARTVWMLAPTLRAERVQRRIILEWNEVQQVVKTLALLGGTLTPDLETRKAKLTAILTSGGTSPRDAAALLKSRPGYGEMVREAGSLTTITSDRAEAAWKACSSMAHGDFRGSFSIGEHETLRTEGTTAIARVSGSPKTMLWGTNVAITLLKHAFHLYEQRATRHH